MAIFAATKENFETEVLQSEQTVLVDFWAAWCAPCRMMGLTLEEYAAQHPEQRIAKVNVDEQPELAREYDVMSIPTLLVFRNGELVRQTVGYCSLEELDDLLQ